LALALDQWADRPKKVRGADDPGSRRLAGVARAADPDAHRNRVRDDLERRDAAALAEIAAGAEVIDLPAGTLNLLVQALDATTGEAVLRRARRKYPDDFWLNFQPSTSGPGTSITRSPTSWQCARRGRDDGREADPGRPTRARLHRRDVQRPDLPD